MIHRQELELIGLTSEKSALARDQTALAADSMSTAISTIRTDSLAVADDIVRNFAARTKPDPRG